MMKTLLRTLAMALAFLTTFPALAADASHDAPKMEKHDWSFAGPFGQFEQDSLQRGFHVFKEVCSSCHTMRLLAFRHLGQKGGPFYDAAYPNPSDNPVIKQIAADWLFQAATLNEFGEPATRAAVPADYMPGPFPNATVARLANGGALPPDLSVIVKARKHGADYISALMQGYEEPPADFALNPGMNYNKYFPGFQIGMAAPLVDDRIAYTDGTPATVAQMSEDVATFLAWASDPKAPMRKQMGFAVLGFMAVLALLLYLSYKQIWRNVEH